jgi:phospholipid transport system substrate-binding protein
MRGFEMGWAVSARVRSAAWLLILVACFAGFSANGARAETPAVYMQRVQNELMYAQRQGGVSAYANVLRQHMDVQGIGLTALGPHMHSLAKTDRPAYYNGMINFIAKYAAKEGPKYIVTSAVVTGQGAGDAGGTNVDTHITLSDGSGYDIRWLVMKTSQGYKVRDAQVVGFWMTSFLDDLFQNYITENGNNPRALVLALSR